MKLLAIDTATEACSVALWHDGAILERYEVAGRSHSVRLPEMVPAVLAEAGLAMAQLDGLVCGIGPGSFAGVRIGVSYAKGLALGVDLPVVGISSLAMLAQAALAVHPRALAAVAIDARMDEVYYGLYRSEAGLAMPVDADRVCPPAAIPALPAGSAAVAAGSGWQVYETVLRQRLGEAPIAIDAAALPHARDALPLAQREFAAGRAHAAAALVPAYLRNRVALTRHEQAALRAVADAKRG